MIYVTYISTYTIVNVSVSVNVKVIHTVNGLTVVVLRRGKEVVIILSPFELLLEVFSYLRP